MLDFDSEIIVWVGNKVPQEKYVSCFKKVGNCARGIHPKGHKRRDKIAFSFVLQGFEPEIFKQAFPTWRNFKRPGLDDDDDEDDHISEESSGESDDEDSGEGNAKTNKTEASTAAATDMSNSVYLTEAQKRQVASYLPESFWINF